MGRLDASSFGVGSLGHPQSHSFINIFFNGKTNSAHIKTVKFILIAKAAGEKLSL